MSHRLPIFTAIVIVFGALATDARAGCFDKPPVPPLALHGTHQYTPTSFSPGENPSGNDIVGLWATTFLLGDGPTIWDQAYEQFHSDGTELAVDNGVPPALGNVCVGIWKQTGKTVKLRHVTWNWDVTSPPGTFAGTFLLLMTVTVGPRGDTFSGTYTADSFDLSGTVIPSLHAEGKVGAVRITVD